MKNKMEKAILALFYAWLDKKYPYFRGVYGLIILLLILLGLLGIYFIWMYSWWWKYYLSLGIVFIFVYILIQAKYRQKAEEFRNEIYRKKNGIQ